MEGDRRLAPRRGVPIDTLKPPEYPWHLARERVLADGRRVLVRPIHPDDLPHEASFLAHLSPQARHQRFQRLSSADLEHLAGFYTRVDYKDHMAFVCTAREGARESIVGDARYLANADGASCEFGIVVADAWRHTGVAQHLMRALLAHAKASGIRIMASIVLRENRDMLDFARELGFEVTEMPDEPDCLRIEKTLH
jgi:acetyltransferase